MISAGWIGIEWTGLVGAELASGAVGGTLVDGMLHAECCCLVLPLCHCSAERYVHFAGITVEMFLPLEIAKVKSFSYLDPLTGVDPRMSRTLSASFNDELQRHVKS